MVRYGGVTFGDNFKNLPSSFTQSNMTGIGLIKEHNAKVSYDGTVNRQISDWQEIMMVIVKFAFCCAPLSKKVTIILPLCWSMPSPQATQQDSVDSLSQEDHQGNSAQNAIGNQMDRVVPSMAKTVILTCESFL